MGAGFRFVFQGRLVLFSVIIMLLLLPGIYADTEIVENFGKHQDPGWRGDTFQFNVPSDYQGCYIRITAIDVCQESYGYGNDYSRTRALDISSGTQCNDVTTCVRSVNAGETITFELEYESTLDCGDDNKHWEFDLLRYGYCGDEDCAGDGLYSGRYYTGKQCINGELVTETEDNCPGDCLEPCGNGVCDIYPEGENCDNCAADCGCSTGACCVPTSDNAVSTGCVYNRWEIDSTHVCCSGSSYTGDCCDDDDCFYTETCTNHQCVEQGPECGDGTCDSGEDCSSCSSDCACPSGWCCSPGATRSDSTTGCVRHKYLIDNYYVCCGGTKYSGDCCVGEEYVCTAGKVCRNYQCVAGTEKGLCEDCTEHGDCDSDWCATFSDDTKKCTTGVAGTCCNDGTWIAGYNRGVDCCADTDCSGGKVCTSHKCVEGSGGTTGLCEDCTSNSDCESNYCITFSSGRKRCAVSGVRNTCCSDNHHISDKVEYTDCCLDSSCTGGKKCVNYKCVESGGNEIGETCTSNSECESGNCRAVCCKAGETCCRYNIDCAESKECNTASNYCVHTSDQCSPGCRDSELGDDSCDALCDTAECDYDEGDCERRGRCNNDDNCDWSEGEDCETCPNDCGCPYYQCCAPDTSYAEPDNWGCISNDDKIDTRTICCDGTVEEASWGQKCEDVYESRKKPYGGSCTKNDDCKSSHCEDGICCIGSYAEGENCCRDQSDCTSARYCSDYHRCELKKGEGAYCNLNVECQSSKCQNSECTVEPELMTYGETCQSPWDCEEGLVCKKGKDTSRMFCCPEGNQWCCSQDTDCAEAVVDDYYCYKGSDIDSSKWFSCQPTTKTIREREYQARRLSGEEKGSMGESCNGNNDDCWSGHCSSNGICCSWGTCCGTNSDCPDGACIPEYHRCVTESPEDISRRTQESFENTIEQRVESDHIEETKEDILGLEAEFYVSTPSKEGEGIIGKKLTSVLVIGNTGDENIYVKARIEGADTHIENERHDISHWDPEKEATWLERVPVINWVINALKQLNTWLWETVQELWSKDDEGFYEIWPGTVIAITYEYEPTFEGWYDFYADIKYYSKVGGEELFSHDSNTNTYEIREIKDITTVKFEKSIWVREPDCGLLGLVCD